MFNVSYHLRGVIHNGYINLSIATHNAIDHHNSTFTDLPTSGVEGIESHSYSISTTLMDLIA